MQDDIRRIGQNQKETRVDSQQFINRRYVKFPLKKTTNKRKQKKNHWTHREGQV